MMRAYRGLPSLIVCACADTLRLARPYRQLTVRMQIFIMTQVSRFLYLGHMLVTSIVRYTLFGCARRASRFQLTTIGAF